MSNCKKWPVYDNREKEALISVLKKGQWGTLGDEALKFADSFKKYCGLNYGISVTNGTISLEIILRSLCIGFDDEVIVSSYTFYSSISSIALVGATPVLADINPDTYNIDLESIKQNISDKTKAIIVTHMGGRMCEMEKLNELCMKKGLYLIEDAAHAHGSTYSNKPIGYYSDAVSVSFQASKNLTCGEGGFIGTNDINLFKEAWHYHTSGRAYDGASEFGGRVLMGTNARMAEWEAAILNVQLERLDEQNETRERNVKYFDSKLKELNCFSFLAEDEKITKNAYHLYIFKFDKTRCGADRETFIKEANKNGVPISSGYGCIHKMPAMMSDMFVKSIGKMVDYNSMTLKNTENACLNEALWLNGSEFLGDISDMDLMLYGIKKALLAIKK